MSDPKKSTAPIWGVLSFLAVLAGGLVYTNSRPRPSRPIPIPPTTTVVAPETHPEPLPIPPVAIDTTGGAPGGPVVVPETPTPPPYTPPPPVEPVVPPVTTVCSTAEELDTANHYASFEGYEALAGKCDWLRGYRAAAASPNPPADLVTYLCDNGYDSPAAEREVQREIIFEGMWQQEVCVQLPGYGDPICQWVKFTDTERVASLRESLADPSAKIVKTLRFWEPCTTKFLNEAKVVSHSAIATATHIITVADVVPVSAKPKPGYGQVTGIDPRSDGRFAWASGDEVWQVPSVTNGLNYWVVVEHGTGWNSNVPYGSKMVYRFP
jgi:hypothetical protein